jgi:cytochrome c-type biogenesis protein CcmH
MNRTSLLSLGFVLMLFAPATFAVTPGEQLPDPAQEARARAISAGLRCLVCQNQSIDDSDASLAQDLRRLVRERIRAGDSDAQIRTFLVARYGEFVLLRPTLSANTALLWGLPGLALLIGAGAAWRLFRRREVVPTDEIAAPALSDTEQAELESILKGEGRG